MTVRTPADDDSFVIGFSIRLCGLPIDAPRQGGLRVDDGMWEELERLHRHLLEVIREHEILCDAAAPDRGALAASRWRVAQAGRERMAFLNTEVFPVVDQIASTGCRGLAEQLRDQTPAYQRRISAYVSQWPTDVIVTNWSEYRAEAKVFREEILQRIQLEADVLRPVLRELAFRERAGDK